MRKIDIKNLNYLIKNDYLRPKVEQIIEMNNIQNLDKMYNECQLLLEFITGCLLAKKFNMKIEKLDLIKIIEKCNDLDNNLAQEMMSINAEYNIINEPTINDIEFLLDSIESIYGYIIEKYGEII